MAGGFCCPVCGGAFAPAQGGLVCENGHCFDRARQGYYNLLLSGKASGTRRGDDGEMIGSRTAFLERGYYEAVRRALCDAVLELAEDGCTVLDAGCGEGYYAQGLRERAQEEGKALRILGADISKDAVKAAARRHSFDELAVASVSRLPIADGACGCVLNIFSPPELKEYARVLPKGGILIRALPLEEHLWSLKKAVYDTPYKNPSPATQLEGFRLVSRRDVRKKITVSPTADILALFAMTPYRDKTSPKDAAKLERLDSLETELAVCLAAYSKE